MPAKQGTRVEVSVAPHCVEELKTQTHLQQEDGFGRKAGTRNDSLNLVTGGDDSKNSA